VPDEFWRRCCVKCVRPIMRVQAKTGFMGLEECITSDLIGLVTAIWHVKLRFSRIAS